MRRRPRPIRRRPLCRRRRCRRCNRARRRRARRPPVPSRCRRSSPALNAVPSPASRPPSGGHPVRQTPIAPRAVAPGARGSSPRLSPARPFPVRAAVPAFVSDRQARETARVQPLRSRSRWRGSLLLFLLVLGAGAFAVHRYLVPLDVLVTWGNPARLAITTESAGRHPAAGRRGAGRRFSDRGRGPSRSDGPCPGSHAPGLPPGARASPLRQDRDAVGASGPAARAAAGATAASAPAGPGRRATGAAAPVTPPPLMIAPPRAPSTRITARPRRPIGMGRAGSGHAAHPAGAAGAGGRPADIEGASAAVGRARA